MSSEPMVTELYFIQECVGERTVKIIDVHVKPIDMLAMASRIRPMTFDLVAYATNDGQFFRVSQ